MKGNQKVLDTLNALLADELAAINQYMVHSEMCDNWGYARLHEKNEKRAIDEMKHAEKLIARIIFLEGIPSVSAAGAVHIGGDVQKQLNSDHNSEDGAIRLYNSAIQEAMEFADNGTREILEDILKDEEAHIDFIESQMDQIQQMGIQNYLVEQIG